MTENKSTDKELDFGVMGEERHCTVYYEFTPRISGNHIDQEESATVSVYKVEILDSEAKPVNVYDFMSESAIEELEDDILFEENDR